MDLPISRRGAAASGAAILVAIIGGLLVGYILFLPPAQREALLFGDNAPPAGGGPGYGPGVFTQYGPVLVLTASPGTLRLLKFPVAEHDIPSTTIFTRIDTEEIKLIESAIVKNGIFARSNLAMTFDADREASRNYVLSFNVDQPGAGSMRVLLNGNVVYERPIREANPQPIVLPFDYIVDGENVLEIRVGSAPFWRANTYALRNVLVTADIMDVQGAHSMQTFSIPEQELASFDAAQLQFVPDCDPKKAGRLMVQLNTRLVRTPDNQTLELPNVLFNGYADCGVLFKTDVPKEYLREGENTVIFASQGGEFVIDRIKMVIRLKQNDYPTYYFNLPAEMYDGLDAGSSHLRLTLTFTDYRNVKTGEIVINGFVQSFSTKEYAYQAIIDPGILTPGPNTIQIAPHVDKLDVAEVKIELV